jgi:hypothetical protein
LYQGLNKKRKKENVERKRDQVGGWLGGRCFGRKGEIYGRKDKALIGG